MLQLNFKYIKNIIINIDLYTLILCYATQELAENALQLLNCVPVNGQSVLFIDGDEHCLQIWQYGIVSVVSIFIFPFFVVLLFGPRLLQSGRIGVFVLMMAFLFPLLFSIPIVYLFIKEYNKNKAEIRAQRKEEEERQGTNMPRRIKTELQAEEDRLSIKSDETEPSDEVRELVCSVVFGPYATGGDVIEGKISKTQVYMYGLCWEGVINFRRLVQVLIAIFINDILTKHITLTFVCFLFLIIHLWARPFKHDLSNTAEAISLSLLLNLAIANLVKAGFYSSQTVPRDSGYLVIVGLEWVETITLILLPVGILLTLFFSIVLRGGKCTVNLNPFRSNKSKSKNQPQPAMNIPDPQITMPRRNGFRNNTPYNQSNNVYPKFIRQLSRLSSITRPWVNEGETQIEKDASMPNANSNINKRNIIIPKVKQKRITRISYMNPR